MKAQPQVKISRRRFVQAAAAAVSVGPLIVPRHVLGGTGYVAPSDTFGGPSSDAAAAAGRPFGGFGLQVRKLADCDVKFLDRVNNTTIYTDFRRVMDRKDIDLVAIATPPHWHALITIAAAQSGKDILCEKPFTHTIAEGRAVVNAVNRYGRVCQVGTFGRFGARQRSHAQDHEERPAQKQLPGSPHRTRWVQGARLERPGRPADVAHSFESRLEHVLREVAA